MSEIPLPASGNLADPVDRHEIIARTLSEIRMLDPELFDNHITSELVKLGAEATARVKEEFGTADEPKWHEGTVESRPMTYHNLAHSGSNPEEIGVSRGALLITHAVNAEAGREVFDPLARAILYNAGANHDVRQNCGRSLLPEGKRGPEYGDERLSAEAAARGFAAVMGTSEEGQTAGTSITSRLEAAVMATAFNAGRQNINYEAWHADPENVELEQAVLEQEVLAAADLLCLTHVRGPVTSPENIVEAMSSNQSGRMLQDVLVAMGVEMVGTADMGQILDIIGQNETLLAKFIEMMEGQIGFFGSFKFSDEAIRKICNGKGIDDLFPGRADNVAALIAYTAALRSGKATPREVWQWARTRAGYES